MTYGYAKSPEVWMPPAMEGFAAVSPFTYDPDKAKELLAEAGYADGQGLPTLDPEPEAGRSRR